MKGLSKAEIRPEEQSEKAEDTVVKTDREAKSRIKRSGQARLVYKCQKTQTVKSPSTRRSDGGSFILA